MISISSRRTAGLTLLGAMAPMLILPAARASDGVSWRCDVDYAHYQRNPLPVGRAVTHVDGELVFENAYTGPDWNSTAKIGFQDGSQPDGNCRCNGILARATPDGKSVNFFVVIESMTVPIATRPIGVPVAFAITINPNQTMTVSLDKPGSRDPVVILQHVTHDTLGLSCSGARARFVNVTTR